MKQIGLRNYKRFKELTPIDLGRVTFLVGANNSGKSTFLKALLLANENTIKLKLPQSYDGEERFIGFENPMFTFDLNNYNAGISNFSRSVNNEGHAKEIIFTISLPLVTMTRSEVTMVDSDVIGFVIDISVMDDDLKVDGERALGKISKIRITDCGRRYFYTFDFINKTILFEIKSVDYGELTQPIDALGQSIKSIFSDVDSANKTKRANIEIANLIDSSVAASIEMTMKDFIRYRNQEDGIMTRSILAHYIENIAESLMPTAKELLSVFDNCPDYEDYTPRNSKSRKDFNRIVVFRHS